MRHEYAHRLQVHGQLHEEDAGHGDKVRRLQPGNAAEVVFFEQYLLAIVYIMVREGEAQYEAAEHKEKFYAPVSIDEERIEDVVAGGVIGKVKGGFGGEVPMCMEQDHEHYGQEPDTVYLWEIELVGGYAAEFVVEAGEHVVGKSK